MATALIEWAKKQLQEIEASGLYKHERLIDSAQGVEITLKDGRKVINFCANNYLGLAAHPRVVAAARAALDRWGYGMASVRFICGTQSIHKELEQAIADFLHCEDSILYAACFDANGGVFEPFFGPEDAIISDELNHASLIDGIRLTKARRFVYKHLDLADLEAKLAEAQSARFRVVVTDGVFSMDGDYAPLDKILELTQRYDALLLVDDSHATGFVGATGRGTPEKFGIMGAPNLLLTGTLGKALGGAMGGYVAGPAPLITLLRQRSRPYLFSNSLSPVVVATTREIFSWLSETTELRDRLAANTQRFRQGMSEVGFDIRPGDHPIVPIMLYDAVLAHKMADALLQEGIYVIGFSYPVVPRGQARIRVQLSAAHTTEHIDYAIKAFAKVGQDLGIISSAASPVR
ncbi:MAG: glycine C-acetyltransferase [Bacteroidia bacterium]|nr:glycine C-acetyltransferase [Bacteroidia bacterium]MCX7652455.1 glycine C-acetyltransferase [Bacteroidia bacterium]MDW8416856.1 glycine C-acetyltransferase [Bacteroidia bacterium]